MDSLQLMWRVTSFPKGCWFNSILENTVRATPRVIRISTWYHVPAVCHRESLSFIKQAWEWQSASHQAHGQDGRYIVCSEVPTQCRLGVPAAVSKSPIHSMQAWDLIQAVGFHNPELTLQEAGQMRAGPAGPASLSVTVRSPRP